MRVRIFSIIISFFMLVFLCAYASEAQVLKHDTVKVRFYQSVSTISPALKENARALDSIADIVSLYSQDPRFHMEIKGWASPEGVSVFNASLSLDRAKAILDYIERKTGLELRTSAVTLSGMGIDWKGLEEAILRDGNVPHADKALDIIRNVPVWQTENGVLVGSRKKYLMDLHGGEVFDHLMYNIFSPLRRAEIVLSYIPEPRLVQVEKPYRGIQEGSPAPQPVPIHEHIPIHRLALKTNLLTDALLMPSLEAEWLIRENWSIAAHGNVAWWSRDSEHRYYQLAAIYPEARWWFRTKGPWHGHYLGIFAGGTWYDLENRGRGYQGEGGFVGLSYGYMFPISRSLSFEVGIGAGYLFTEYREYLPVPYMGGTHYVYQQTSRMNYLGPLKLKFSFVWRLWDADWNRRNRLARKGGER